MRKAFKKEIVLLAVLLLGVLGYLLLSLPRLEGEDSLPEQKMTTDSPFILRFTQAMDKKSVERAVSIHPKVEVDFVWQGRKALEIHPKNPLAIGDRYRLRITKGPKSIYKKALKEPSLLIFVVTGPPFVKWVNPGDGVIKTDQRVTVMFDRPMTQDTAVSFLKIDPPVKGKIEWTTPTIFQFIPEAWPWATTFHLTVPQGIPSSSGGNTAEDFSWELKTPAPKVVQSTPLHQETLGVKGVIQLEFNQKIDLEALRPGDNVLLYPSNDVDADKNPRKDGFFNGEITHGKNPKMLVLTPAFPYQPDQEYRLVIKAGLKGEGEHPMTEDFELLFHAKKEGEEDRENPEKPLAAELCPLSQATFFEISERFGWKEYHCSDSLKLEYTPQEDSQDPLAFNVQKILKQEMPTGIYFLALQKGDQRLAQPFFKTNSILLLKKSSEGVLVWTLDEKGQPLPKMELSFLDRTGKVLAEGFTNEEGLYRLQKEFEEGLYVRGKKGNAWAMISDLGKPQSSSFNRKREASEPYFITDKTNYKPGETLYFNGLYRLDRDAALTLPERAKIEVKIEDSDRVLQAALKPVFGRYGSFYGEWKIPDAFKPGPYFLVIHLTQNDEKNSFEQSLIIEDPERPELIVQPQDARSDYLASEPITLDFESTSSSGFVAAGLKGKWILYNKTSSQKVTEESFTWDERGKTRLTFDAKKLNLEADHPYSLWIEAEESDGRIAGTQVDFKVHQGTYDLKLSTNRYWARTGEEIVLTIIATDSQGNLLRGKKINLSLGSDKIIVETEEKPKSILFKLPGDPGFYSVRAESKDERGHLLQTQIQIGAMGAGFSSPFDELELILDQPDYLVGGKAKLLLLAPKTIELPKKVLLTYERGTLLSHQIIDLESPNQPVDILIQEAMVPNFFVTATVFDEKKEMLLKDTVLLKVSPREKEIKIDLSPQITHENNQKKVTLKARSYDYQERPVSAQLSLQVSENAIPIRDPQDYFYAPRPLEVKSLSNALMGETEEVLKKEEFPFQAQGKTLYFNPALKTDAAGIATVEFTLPADFLRGEIRATAVAQADRFGAAKVPLEIKRTPFLRPHLPSFVFVGDRFTMETEIVNPQEQDFETKIELIAPDLKIIDDPQKKVFLKKGETAILQWDVAILETSKSFLQVAFRTPETFASQELMLHQESSVVQDLDFLEFKIKEAFDASLILREKEGLQKDLDSLKAFETLEGGYSLWARSEMPDPFFSAYALFLFREAPKKELVDYLWKTLESDGKLSLEQRFFMLWALSEAGEYDTKATVALFQKRAEAPLAAQGLLLLNLHQLVQAGQKSVMPLVERLKSELVSHAIQEEEKAHFEEEKASYFKSPQELTGVLLFALKEVSPTNPLLEPLMQYLASAPQARPEESGELVLKRTYPSLFKQGDMVRGRLEIFVPQALNHVILEEPLPAGFQARAFDLRLADPLVADREEEKAHREGYTFIPNPVWNFNHHEIKSDRFLLFAEHLPAGVYTIEFLAEAVHVGEFYHRPALLYSLFQKDWMATTPGEKIKIQ